jgi:pimeloyl-ACP methyl ester carboxylesterase
MRLQFLRAENGFEPRPACTCFIVLLFLLNTIDVAAEQIAKVTQRGTKMLVHTPRAYSATSLKYPLLVFLHGPGESGDDLDLLTSGSKHAYPAKLISGNKWNDNLPFIVVSPQLKNNAATNPRAWTPAYIDDVIEFVKQKYRVDLNRIYLTGVSTGATACWDYAAAFPAKVAAIIPVSGKAPEKARLHLLKNVPVWAFHGENDIKVPPVDVAESIGFIKSLKGLFTPRMTVLFAQGHGGWSELYNGESGYNIYEWMLRFSKSDKRNLRPYVHAGFDRTTHQGAGSHVIAGDFFDWDGKVADVKWVQVSGARLSIDGVNTAFLQIGELKAGTFEFQLNVTDNNGATSSDKVRLEVSAGLPKLSVTALMLIPGKANDEIRLTGNEMVINRSNLEGGFSLKAVTSSSVRSVRYSLGSNVTTQIANAPFMLGKSPSAKWIPSNTSCVICATPYSETGGKGQSGVSFCARVTFTHPSPASVSGEVPLKIRAIDDILVSNMASGNQWVCNGRDVPGATGPIFKPSSPGEYFVRQITRSSFDVSNLVKFGTKAPGPSVARVDVFPHPAQGYIQVKAESLPFKSSYRILRGGVTIQQGELHDDRKIALATRLPKGNYVLIINGKKDDAGTKFVIR